MIIHFIESTMKKLILLFTVSLFVITSSYAQREATLFNDRGGIDFTGVWGGSTNALVDFNNDFNLNSGGFFAFELNNDFLIGWSGYKSDINDNGQNIEIKGNDLFLGYTFNSYNLIHPLLYLQTGSGKLEVEGVGSDRVFITQPTVGVEANIARFFRLGIDGGYRFLSGSDLDGYDNQDLAGPVINLRLKFGWSWD